MYWGITNKAGDDLLIDGNLTAIPEPMTRGAFFMGAALLFLGRRTRRVPEGENSRKFGLPPAVKATHSYFPSA